MQKINFIFTRFVFLSKRQEFWSIFRSRNIDFETYKGFLFSEASMRERLDIFINYQQPLLAIAAERFPIFHYVMSSVYLPDFARGALDEAAIKYPFLKIEYFDENSAPDVGGALIRRLSATGGAGETNVAAIRLDDDDLLHPLYFENMDRYTQNSFIGLGVSHSLGTDGYYENGAYSKFQKRRMPFNSQGLAYITKVIDGKFVTRYVGPPGNHVIMDLTNPAIVDGTINAFFYSVHSTSMHYHHVAPISEAEIQRRHFSKPDDYKEIDDYWLNIFSKNNGELQ